MSQPLLEALDLIAEHSGYTVFMALSIQQTVNSSMQPTSGLPMFWGLDLLNLSRTVALHLDSAAPHAGHAVTHIVITVCWKH